ncbi:MAG: Flp family type IVb pilin [Acidithiobacillus sp.]
MRSKNRPSLPRQGEASNSLRQHMTDEKGQSSIEYAIVAVFAIGMLFAGDPSPVAQLMEALRKFAGDYSWAASIATLPF